MNQNNPTLLKTLLVSTDRNLLELLRRLTGELRHYRCQIEWKKTRRTALKALQTGDYDVCLIEYDFREETNLPSLHEVVTTCCRTPLIVLTDETNEVAHLEAMRQGAMYCLPKEKIAAPLLETVIGYTVERFGSSDELRENVFKFRNLVETLPVMIYAAEPNPPYSPIYISPAFEAFGFPLEEWNKCMDFWVRLLHPEDRERVLRETSTLIQSGRETDLEYRVITKNGDVRWVHDRGHFVRDEKGNTVCWQGIILDITKRKQAEKALRDSEAQFKSAFEDAAVGMAIASLDGRWVRVNRQLCEMLGYTKEELTDRRFSDLTHPDDVDSDSNALKPFMSGKTRIYQCEKRFIHKNGGIVWSFLNSSLVRDETGNPTHFIAEMQDISDHKQLIENLRESEGSYRELFENANDIIYTRELNGKFTSLNRTGELITGYTRQEMLEMTTSQIVAPDYLEAAREMLARQNTDEPSPVYEIVIISKQGERISLELSTSLIMRDGEPVGVQGIARDINERKRAEMFLQASEAELKDLFDNAPTGYHEIDREGRIVRINRTELEMLGYEAVEVVGRFAWEFVVEPVARESVIKKLAGEKKMIPMERTFRRRDGSLISVLIKDTLIKDENGTITGLRANIQDITEQKQAEQALKDSERRYRLLGEGIMHQVWTAQPDGKLDYVNARMLEYFGRNFESVIGDGWQQMIHPEDLPKCLKRWAQSLETGEDYEMECRLQRHDGKYRWHKAVATAAFDADGRVINWFGTNSDMNDKKLAEASLSHNALHDALTNLPNRVKFLNHLQRAVKQVGQNSAFRFAVLFLDLDRFKLVNDSLGHSVGDRLLIAISERLEACVRPGDIVARLSGDEFTVLLYDVNDASDAVLITNRFMKKIAEPFQIDGYEVFTSASVGIVVSDEIPRQPEDFLRDADAAMYRAKESGKARYEIFNREMHIRNINLLQMENDLRKAIEQEEFRVFYQPIVRLDTGEILEFEALIRWQHPKQGLVAPNEFIGIAEETGLIIPIGKWILREACRQTVKWQRLFPTMNRLSINVNLSAKELMYSDLAAQVEFVLAQTNLDPQCLKLEVTESIVMENSDKALSVIAELHALKVSLSTDDFGTGYSSLSYLHNFPFDCLKIDRSFINKMDKDQKSEAIVRTILMLGENLNIKTIAEGIETESQLKILRQLGCKTGQGFLFSKPVTAENAEQLLRNGLPDYSTIASFYRAGETENYQLLKPD